MESHTDPKTGPERISHGPLARRENRDHHRRGIGLAIAEALAAPAATVIVADLKHKDADREAKTITDKGWQGLRLRRQRRRPGRRRGVGGLRRGTDRGPALLVNNAGISGPAVKTGDHPIDKYRRAPQWRLPRQRYAIPAM
ncbi:MAG: Rossmann-fold NAD(P)-binding domain-containing protein [Salipiger thiooxidans]|uniref:hypothetical protein n=1 Tax=Salipiger thiooxidans TaxID=282683 RepID=UPI001CFA8BDD|nr:hypothetical protein [Salipiger thiooxidans]